MNNKLNYKAGIAKFEDRDFQIEFWKDNCGFRWVRLCEMVDKIYTSLGSKVKNDSRKKVERFIKMRWMNDNRLEWALRTVEEYLKKERKIKLEEQQIDDFCNRNVQNYKFESLPF